MSSREVAAYLGVTPGTISNWTLINSIKIAELREAIDAGRVSLHATRAFAGLTEEGQRILWERHREEIERMSAGRLHRFVREQYPPSKFPELYEAPEKVHEQLKRGKQKRRPRKRPEVSRHEKEVLLKDVDAKKIEIEDKKAQIRELQSHIDGAIPVVQAIRETPALWESLPKNVLQDFEDFADRFIAK
jgi:hypothetical protein